MQKIEYDSNNTRKCSACKETKNINLFKNDKKASQGKGWVCTECSRLRARTFYASRSQEKKQIYGEAKKRATLRNQRWICNYLLDHPCTDCGQTDIEFLDFHHLADKVQDLCTLVRGGYRLETLTEEIAKCEVVCLYCHRKRTNRHGNNYRYRFALGQL